MLAHIHDGCGNSPVQDEDQSLVPGASSPIKLFINTSKFTERERTHLPDIKRRKLSETLSQMPAIEGSRID